MTSHKTGSTAREITCRTIDGLPYLIAMCLGLAGLCAVLSLCTGCASTSVGWTATRAAEYATTAQPPSPERCWYAAWKWNYSKPGECLKESREIADLCTLAGVPHKEEVLCFVERQGNDVHITLAHAVVTGRDNGRYWIAHQYGFHSGATKVEALSDVNRIMGKEYVLPD